MAFGSVNPLQRGLGVVTHSDLYRFVQGQRQLLTGKWIVFSDAYSSSGFVEATGCNTYTGMRFLPDIDHLSLFASRGLNARTFNNGTWLLAHPIESKQKSSFEIVNPVITRWNVNPFDPLVKQVGVKYFAFDQQPSAEIAAGLVPLASKPVDHFWLYRLP